MPPQPDKTAAYLSRLLRMNPADAADEIVALRARALGIAKKQKPASGAEDLDKLRAAARRRLDAVRAGCWKASQDRLLAELDKLPADKLPEVRVAADRLRALVTHRDRLPGLTQHRDFDGEFFSCFKQVLTEAPKETAVLREQVLASFRKAGGLRKRGRRMIALLKAEAPEIYAIEADWLDSLVRQKVVARVSSGSASPDDYDEGRSGSCLPVLGVGGPIILIVILRLLIAVFSKN